MQTETTTKKSRSGLPLIVIVVLAIIAVVLFFKAVFNVIGLLFTLAVLFGVYLVLKRQFTRRT